MTIRKTILFCLALIMACTGFASAEGQTDAQRIEELDTQVQELQAYIDELEEQLGIEGNACSSEDAAAEFNGGTVSVAEASAAYGTMSSYYEMMGMDASEYEDEAKMEVLQGLVEDKILENKARELGVYDLTEEQSKQIEESVQKEFDENVEYYMAFRFDESKTEEQIRQETIDYLSENGYSYEALLAEATKNVWRDNLYSATTKDIQIDEAELKSFYDSEVQSSELSYSADYAEYESDLTSGRPIFWNPAGVRRIQAILIGFDEEQSAEYAQLQSELESGAGDKLDQVDALYEQLMPRAQEALKRIENGEDFQTVMQDVGEDEEMKKGSVYYVSEQSSNYEAAFLNAAMALEKPGAHSDCVNTDAGIYILYYESDVLEGAVPYEEIHDQMLEVSTEEIKQGKYNDMVENWIEQAQVRYYPERF